MDKLEKLVKSYDPSITQLINKLKEICNDEEQLTAYFEQLEENKNISYIIDEKTRYMTPIILEMVKIENQSYLDRFVGVNINLLTGEMRVGGLNKGDLQPIIVSYMMDYNLTLPLFKKATNCYFKKLNQGIF